MQCLSLSTIVWQELHVSGRDHVTDPVTGLGFLLPK